MSAARPDPDALLARVQAEETLKERGRLKIFFGMAPGVGKTYAMLEAARKVAKEGADLIVGYVEPHCPARDLRLGAGTRCLAEEMVDYRGRMIPEFDLQLALSRKPQVIVVDDWLTRTHQVRFIPNAGKMWRICSTRESTFTPR